jgi:hypothetical protein
MFNRLQYNCTLSLFVYLFLDYFRIMLYVLSLNYDACTTELKI